MTALPSRKKGEIGGGGPPWGDNRDCGNRRLSCALIVPLLRFYSGPCEEKDVLEHLQPAGRGAMWKCAEGAGSRTDPGAGSRARQPGWDAGRAQLRKARSENGRRAALAGGPVRPWLTAQPRAQNRPDSRRAPRRPTHRRKGKSCSSASLRDKDSPAVRWAPVFTRFGAPRAASFLRCIWGRGRGGGAGLRTYFWSRAPWRPLLWSREQCRDPLGSRRAANRDSARSRCPRIWIWRPGKTLTSAPRRPCCPPHAGGGAMWRHK